MPCLLNRMHAVYSLAEHFLFIMHAGYLLPDPPLSGGGKKNEALLGPRGTCLHVLLAGWHMTN